MNKEMRLKQCEEIILEGLESMYKVNRAFSIIKDMELYEGEYKSFNHYCQIKWDVQNRYQDLKAINSCFGFYISQEKHQIIRSQHESGK
jgi:hypothetical protein